MKVNPDYFWSKVNTGNPSECWEYKGHITKAGYGKTNGVLAHRYSWEVHNGPIPAGLFVCHKCDNPPCVNPNHLFLGTQTDNMQDMWKKGRGPKFDQRGNKNPNRKLSQSIADKIRKQFTGKWGEIEALGRQYGVTGAAISYILKNKSWNYSEGEVAY